ncbi:MAG: glycosyltransferase, partial [Candidatus Binatia bacterium]
IDALVVPSSVHAEVLVVDNGSADETGRILAAQSKIERVVAFYALTEARKGKARALNRAIAVAKGDILLIVDDDVVVDSQLLVRHMEAHREYGFDAMQGRILPGVDPDGNPADKRRLGEYNIPNTDYGERVCEIRGLTGTNMSFKRKVIEKTGGFDSRLGPGAAGFSEDTEFSMRIRQAGFKIGYTPHAIVYHELNPRRYGRRYNRDVEYRKGISRSLYRNDSIFLRVIPNLIGNCARFCLYRFSGRAQKAYKTEGRIMKCWGYLMGKVHRAKSSSNFSV